MHILFLCLYRRARRMQSICGASFRVQDGVCEGPVSVQDTARRRQSACPAAPGVKSREKQGQHAPKRRSKIENE